MVTSESEKETFEYLGQAGTKQLAFQNKDEILFASFLVSAEESEAWKACQEMLTHSVKMSAGMVKGFYGLDLLSLSLAEGLKHFDSDAFCRLIYNHSRKLEPGQKRVFPYGCFLFSLSKRIPEEFGKIDFKTHVEVFRKSRSQLDLHIKKKCTDALAQERFADKVKQVVIYDLSRESLFRFGDDAQTERLASFLKKNKPTFEAASLRVTYAQTEKSAIDLMAQFQV